MTQQDKMRAMQELGVNEGAFNGLLRWFIVEAEESLVKLDAAIKADDFAGIARIGHGLKGMAANLCINGIRDMARALEMSAKERKDKQVVMEQAAALKQAMAELK